MQEAALDPVVVAHMAAKIRLHKHIDIDIMLGIGHAVSDAACEREAVADAYGLQRRRQRALMRGRPCPGC